MTIETAVRHDTSTAGDEAPQAADLPTPRPHWIDPAAIRYIKLGAGGAWEQEAFADGLLLWGSDADPHAAAAAGDWDAAREAYRSRGLTQGTATGYLREIRDFYTAGSDTLWITFARGHLWWAFAGVEVGICQTTLNLQRPKAFRRVIGRWRNTDLEGRPLAIADLSTVLTRTAAYQQTICSIEAEDYLKRKITGQANPAVSAAREAQARLTAALVPLIQQLHQTDFEVFVDLLFIAMGWRRTSALGGSMKAIDLFVELPATGERAAVQVKSVASQAVIEACSAAFRDGLPGDRFYLVTHTTKGALRLRQDNYDPRPIIVMDGPTLAAKASQHNLTDWLLRHTA